VRRLAGGAKAGDLLLTRLYFGLAAWQWAALGQDEQHMASFEAGLARCRPPARVLDIGCGAGGSAAAIARRFPSAEVIGTDVSRTMIGEARKRHSAPNLIFRRAGSSSLPFADGEFDLVTLHNATPEMHELRRVLAPEAEVMTASTFAPLEQRTHAERGRWADFALELKGAEDVREGAWELFGLRREPPPPPLV
jgi:ubiquinone/menaquinone biosynthesis C-methylase UbiE